MTTLIADWKGRMPFNTWAMAMAVTTSRRASCLRASVGCILLDRHKKILATGYNGVPRKMNHCDENCPGMLPGGNDNCMATHAEINAIAQCSDIEKIEYVVCTHLPCFRCAKALCNTGMKILYYKETHKEEEKVMRLLTQKEDLFIIQFGEEK